MSEWLSDIYAFRKEAIVGGIMVTIPSALVFALVYEVTAYYVRKFLSKRGASSAQSSD